MFGKLFGKKHDEFEGYYSEDLVDDPDLSRLTPSRREALQRSLAELRGRSATPRMWPHFLVHLLILALVVGAVRLTAGEVMTMKLMKAIISPVGLVWIALFMTSYAMTISRQACASFVAWGAWLILTLAGNSYVANFAISSIEQPFLETKPLEMKKFDVIVVLGGGTTTAPNGPQLSIYGDRIMLAARMYEAGKADRIICTGSYWQPMIDGELQINEQARQILAEAGVPVESLVGIKGINTVQEIDSVAKWLKANPCERVGVITSAWHLPRALRIAKKKGVAVFGLPADFGTQPIRQDPHLLVPGVDNLRITGQAFHEYLGNLIGQ